MQEQCRTPLVIKERPPVGGFAQQVGRHANGCSLNRSSGVGAHR